MNSLRAIIDDAVGEAIAEHPKYFTPKGIEHARGVIVRKIMAAFRDDAKTEIVETKPEAKPPALTVEATSREARGYVNLRKLAGAVTPYENKGMIYIPAEATSEAVYALADLPERHQWIFLVSINQITAWHVFFDEKLPGLARRGIMQNDSINGREGILMPYPWPPSKTGKVYEPAEMGV